MIADIAELLRHRMGPGNVAVPGLRHDWLLPLSDYGGLLMGAPAWDLACRRRLSRSPPDLLTGDLAADPADNRRSGEHGDWDLTRKTATNQ
jgi:hypothetical protein